MSPLDFWTPFYGARYLADTKHLDLAHHGAYLLLLIQYWAKGPLPDDDSELCRIVGTDIRTWRKIIAPKLRPFFTTKDGKLHQKRADIELARQADISAKRSAASRSRRSIAGANAPSIAGSSDPPNALSNDGSNGTHTVPITQYPVTSTEKREVINKNPLPLNDLDGSRARDERQPDDWENELGIEPPPRIDRTNDPEKLSDNPAVETHIRRAVKACSMRTHDYGSVHSKEVQIAASTSHLTVVETDAPVGLKWQPADPTMSREQYIAAAERDASPEQIEKARRAFTARARAHA